MLDFGFIPHPRCPRDMMILRDEGDAYVCPDCDYRADPASLDLPEGFRRPRPDGNHGR